MVRSILTPRFSIFLAVLFALCNNSYSVVRVSTGSGSFFTPATWSPAGVPSSTDDLTIQAGHVVTISGSHGYSRNLTIDGTLRFSDLASSRTLNVFGVTTINGTGVFDADATSNFNHIVKFFDNVANNGNLDYNIDSDTRVVAYYMKAGNQTHTGTGTNDFYKIDVRNGVKTRSTDFNCSNFTVPSGFLTLTSGTVKFSLSSSGTINLFSTNATIGSTCGVWINSTNVNFTVSGSLYVNGDLTVDTGTLTATGSMAVGNNLSSISGTFIQNGGSISIAVNVDLSKGTSTLTGGTMTVNNNLIIGAALSCASNTLTVGNGANKGILFNGGSLTLTSGTVNVSGYIGRYTASAVTNLTINGGTVTVNTSGMTSAGVAPFNILTAGSTFSMTGGTVVIQRSGASNKGIEFTGLAANGITGGTFQFGNGSTPAATTMLINTPVQLFDVQVNSANVNASLNTNALTIANDLTITAGTLTSNALTINAKGDWTNSGGTFNGGTGTVNFSGSGAQLIAKTGGTETFNNVVFQSPSSSSLASAISTRNLTINNGATFDISASNYSVTLTGDFTNDGSFNAQSGNLNFSGSNAQSLISSTTTDLYDLTINKSSNTTTFSSGTYNINNSVTLTSGSLANAGATVTLTSDATKTARIGNSQSSGTFSGNFVIQKHISGRTASWHDLSSPVVSTTLFDWDDEMFMSGVSSSDSPVGIAGDDGWAGSFQSVVVYDESGSAFDPLTTNTGALIVGKGYEIWFADDMSNWNAKTITTVGTPNKGSISIPVQNTGDGNNLVGNPFASSILWGSCTRSNLDANFYMLDNSGNFGTYGLADEIPPHQGFWVYSSSGSPSLTIPENSKTTTTATNFHREKIKDFTLTLSGNMTPFYHTIRLNKNEEATINYDSEFDGIYIKSPLTDAPALTMAIEGNREMVLNVLNSNQNEFSIPLRVKAALNGNYVIETNNVNVFEAYSCIVLEDLLTQTKVDLRKNKTYNFLYTSDMNPNRFVLHVSKDENCNESKQVKSFDYENLNEIKFVTVGSNLRIDFNMDAATKATIKVYDMQGNQVLNENNVIAYSNNYTIVSENLSSGVYSAVVEYNGKRQSRKFVVIK